MGVIQTEIIAQETKGSHEKSEHEAKHNFSRIFSKLDNYLLNVQCKFHVILIIDT